MIYRRPLFRRSNVLPHDEGLGTAAFDWRAAQLAEEARGGEETKSCTQSLFIEPVQWMEQDILQIEGKVWENGTQRHF